MTYEDIVKANESIQTLDMKGKAYAEVNQRIKAFRMLYPEGYIHTHFFSLENGVAIIMAEVGYYREDGSKVELGTGTAYEKEGSSFINKTSYIENCETSAVGRALGMCGLGIDTSIASAEEVQNAQLQQTASKAIGTVKAKAFMETCKKSNIDVFKFMAANNIEKLEDMTEEMHSGIHNHWEAFVKQYGGTK